MNMFVNHEYICFLSVFVGFFVYLVFNLIVCDVDERGIFFLINNN